MPFKECQFAEKYICVSYRSPKEPIARNDISEMKIFKNNNCQKPQFPAERNKKHRNFQPKPRVKPLISEATIDDIYIFRGSDISETICLQGTEHTIHMKDYLRLEICVLIVLR